MRIILGSQSPFRRKVLTDAGWEFEVITPDIDEKAIRHDDPENLTLALAKAKAEAVLAKARAAGKTPAVIITSDQVVVCNGKILEKPQSAEEARQVLHGYAKHPAQTVTAVAVINAENGREAAGVDIVSVFFRPIEEESIENFIASGSAFRCAGSFNSEDTHIKPFITKMEGTPDSVSGMPLALTERLIEEVGGR